MAGTVGMVIGVSGEEVARGAKKELIRARGFWGGLDPFFLGGPSPMSLLENAFPKYHVLGCGHCLAGVTSSGVQLHDRGVSVNSVMQ